VLHLQPQVSLRAGRVEAVEALARWERPGHGMLLPGAFMPAVGANGLARRFDSWALRAAVSEAAALSGAGHPLRVAVNIAPCSLADPHLADEVACLLDRAGLEPDALEIEVTEQALDESSRAATTLSELSALGVTTALDDFGVGFSSLTRVASLPFSTVKLDRSLVADVDRCPRAATVCAAAVRLAHDLGLAVVAEGVETVRTWAHCAKLGAERAQGWVIDPALPRSQLISRVRAGDLAVA
jgi:EAL domain-containing protein (putative c-di-GMP-specific phosphodiesterase class I)